MGIARELAELGSAYNSGGINQFRNRIINGAMSVWQRGTSFAGIATGTYTVDRWQNTIGGSSINLTASQSTSVPSNNFAYSLQYQQISSSATSVTEYAARQRFELNNVRDLAGSSVSISFWYRSNVVGTHGVRILPLGTTGGVDTSVAITVNSANTWEYKTVTTTALSAITSWGSTANNAAALILDIGLRVNGVGQTTIAANDYFQLTGVQLEKGSTATSFDYRPYGTELALCQRYCVVWKSTRAYAGAYIGRIGSSSTASFFAPGNFRAAPTITSSGTLLVNGTTANGTVSGFPYVDLGGNGITFGTDTNAVMTAGQGTVLLDNGSNNSSITFNAEL